MGAVAGMRVCGVPERRTCQGPAATSGRGSRRMRAADTAPSAQSRRGLELVRRRTVTSAGSRLVAVTFFFQDRIAYGV